MVFCYSSFFIYLHYLSSCQSGQKTIQVVKKNLNCDILKRTLLVFGLYCESMVRNVFSVN